MPTSSHPPIPKIPVVSVSGLTAGWNGRPAVSDVSFQIHRGDIAAIIGPNGSGKSTLMRTILGLLQPISGDTTLFGRPPKESYGKIGYVPQKFRPDPEFPMTVIEFLRISRNARTPKGRLKEVLGEVGLNYRLISKTPLAHLSGGQMQRVLVARAILNSPDILFMDEPASGVDAPGEELLLDVMRHLNTEHGTTIVLISHDVSVIAKIVTHVVCLNGTLVCFGTPHKALTSRNLHRLYGDDWVPHTHE